LRALRPGAAGLKGSGAHPIDGERHNRRDWAGECPGPISKISRKLQIRFRGFTHRREGADRGVAGYPRRRGSGRLTGSR